MKWRDLGQREGKCKSDRRGRDGGFEGWMEELEWKEWRKCYLKKKEEEMC